MWRVVCSTHQVKVSSAVFFRRKHSSECKQNVSTCELQWLLHCSRRETLASEDWAADRTRILSMVDGLLDTCSVKLFSFDLHEEVAHRAPLVSVR